jgi:hypothetical protein
MFCGALYIIASLAAASVLGSSDCTVGGVYLGLAAPAEFNTPPDASQGSTWYVNPCVANQNPLGCGGRGWPPYGNVEMSSFSPGYGACDFVSTNEGPWALTKDRFTGELVAAKSYGQQAPQGCDGATINVTIGCFGSTKLALQCVNASGASGGCEVATVYERPHCASYQIRLSSSVMCKAKPPPKPQKTITVKRYAGNTTSCAGHPVSVESRDVGACVPGIDLKTSTQWMCNGNNGAGTLQTMAVLAYANSTSCEGQATVFAQAVGCDSRVGVIGSVLIHCP